MTSLPNKNEMHMKLKTLMETSSQLPAVSGLLLQHRHHLCCKLLLGNVSEESGAKSDMMVFEFLHGAQ